jgi:hypothetical protein
MLGNFIFDLPSVIRFEQYHIIVEGTDKFS